MLEVVFVSIVLWETGYSIVQSNLFPILKQQLDSLSKPVMPDKLGAKVHKSPIEEQFEWFESPPVIDFYKDKVPTPIVMDPEPQTPKPQTRDLKP